MFFWGKKKITTWEHPLFPAFLLKEIQAVLSSAISRYLYLASGYHILSMPRWRSAESSLQNTENIKLTGTNWSKIILSKLMLCLRKKKKKVWHQAWIWETARLGQGCWNCLKQYRRGAVLVTLSMISSGTAGFKPKQPKLSDTRPVSTDFSLASTMPWGLGYLLLLSQFIHKKTLYTITPEALPTLMNTQVSLRHALPLALAFDRDFHDSKTTCSLELAFFPAEAHILIR